MDIGRQKPKSAYREIYEGWEIETQPAWAERGTRQCGGLGVTLLQVTFWSPGGLPKVVHPSQAQSSPAAEREGFQTVEAGYGDASGPGFWRIRRDAVALS